MAGENIFALRLSQPKPQQVTPPGLGGVPFQDGFRAILSVTIIWAKLQTTVLFGNSLYMIWYDIGTLSRQDGFKAFLKPYFGTSVPAGQLSTPPFAATPSLYVLRQSAGSLIPSEAPPVATGNVTMLDAGFDPFRGYWIEFANNFFLSPPNGFPLFQNWPNVIRDGPTFKGAQPSANNPNPTPGSGGSGGGVGGTGGIPPTTC